MQCCSADSLQSTLFPVCLLPTLNIDTLRYELLLIGITEDGHWLKADSVEDIRSGAWKDSATEAVISPDATKKSVILTEEGNSYQLEIDVAFPILHGPYGEV